MQHKIIRLTGLLLALTMLSACSAVPNWNGREPQADLTPIFTEPELKSSPVPAAAPKANPVETTRQRLQPLLAAGEQVSAIAIIRQELRNGLREQDLAEEYLAAINGLLARSDRLNQAGDFGQAGQLLQTVVDNYPRSAELIAAVALSRDEVIVERDQCAEELMEEGLAAYRAEQFDRALAIWQQILGFDPDHAAARKAAQTTELQLANLRSMKGR